MLFVALALMFAALVVTWSVGSTTSAFVALLAGAALAFASGLGPVLHWRRIWALAAAGVVVAAFYLLPQPLNPHKPSLWTEAFSSARWHEGWPTRVAIWETTWHMIAAHPWLSGSGRATSPSNMCARWFRR